MAGSLAGSRIRELRTRKKLNQSALAAAAGISPSYLNLIENNKRRAAGWVLVAIAQVLETRPADLSDGADTALLSELREAATLFPDARAETQQVEDFAGRFPGWTRLLTRLYRRGKDQEAAISALSDRLTHDPFLGESLHAMLSNITAIRSTASILAQMDAIPAAQRRQFHETIHAESRRLSDVAEDLAKYLARSATQPDQAATPEEALDQFLSRHAFHFAALDQAAEVSGIADDLNPVIDDILAQDFPDGAETAPAIIRDHLARYGADAIAMPLGAFHAAARETGYDPGQLAVRFGQDVHAVFRRLSTLRRPSVEAPEMGLMTVTASGYPLLRKPLPDFPMPRHGNACPLWPLFQCLGQPGRPLIATVEHDTGRRFSALALALPRPESGFGDIPDIHASMLIVRQDESPYKAAPAAKALVGTSCRICARTTCAARSAPQILA